MELIYINSGLSSVFESQVLGLLKYLQSKGGLNRILLLYGYRNREEKMRINALMNQSGIEVFYFRVYPNYSFFNSFTGMSAASVIKKSIINPQKTVVHCRGELIAWILQPILLKTGIKIERILVDVRGAAHEEIKEFSSLVPFLKALKIKNYYKALKSLNKFMYISTVSESLKEYIFHQTRVNKELISVIPCPAGIEFNVNKEKRSEIRKSLNISEEEILFLFSSGGTGGWQNINTLEVMAVNGWKVLNLSKAHIDNSNVINRFVPYKEVPYYLSAADVAVISREESIVNKVASPVKFSEYVCSGLPVIATPSVDSINSFIRETGF